MSNTVPAASTAQSCRHPQPEGMKIRRWMAQGSDQKRPVNNNIASGDIRY
jgi:hypothetical protein